MVRLKDVEAAERRLDEAMAALRTYSETPSSWWGCHERLGDNDLRQLVLSTPHFEHLEQLQRNVEAALNALRLTQQAFAGGS